MLPIVSGLLQPWGILPKPYLSSLAMSLSSLAVVLTSNLLILLPYKFTPAVSVPIEN
jgi:hypothetical protein